MMDSQVDGGSQRGRHLNAVALRNAVLCAECDVVSDSPHDRCLVCGSRSLFNIARMFGGDLPKDRASLIVRATGNDAARNCADLLRTSPTPKEGNGLAINPRNRTHLYYSTVKRCRDCAQKSCCTRGKYRMITIHTCEPARQRAHGLAKTPAFAIAQRARRKVEALFAELKNQIGLRRLRLRRMRFVREQFYLAAKVQNLKRLVRFLTCKPAEEIATA